MVSDWTKAAAAVGFASASVQDPQHFFRWLVAYYNAHGGLDGRLIKPVYVTIDGSSSDYSTASQAGCATLTQDNHVEAVVSVLWINPTLTSCLLHAGVTQFEGTQEVLNDTHSLTQSPNLFVSAGLSTNREATALINGSVRTGWLTSKDTLGVVLDSCEYNTRAEKEAVEPLARRYGFKLDVIVAFDCGAGFADVGKFSSGVQSAELKMRTDNVTKVMFLTQGENGSLTFFSSDAESQHWNPTYLVSSNAMITTTEGMLQQNQKANVKGIGWYPALDTDNAAPTSQVRLCLQRAVAGGGQVPSVLNDSLTLYASCNTLFLLDAALHASGGAGGLAALQAGVEHLATSFVSVVALRGATRFGPGRHDGAATAAPFAFTGNCSCFRYVGAPQQVP